MRIAVIASAYVGLVSACFAEIGHDVISVDDDGVKNGATHPEPVSMLH
ncbi:MAG: hypothetical protein ABSF59_24390 [Candidatus Sulfotelmatobacter sp.]